MSRSVKGILCYGIAFTDRDDEDDEARNELLSRVYEKWENVWREKCGIVKPTGKNYSAPEWDNWQREIQENEEKTCQFDIHGDLDDSPVRYYAYVSKAHYSIYVGEIQEILSTEISPTWDAQLKEFCEALELPYEQPKWLLLAYYG